jgi:hypothetical protein
MTAHDVDAGKQGKQRVKINGKQRDRICLSEVKNRCVPFVFDLVDARQGEADVNEEVLARPHLRHMLQANALADAAEIHLAHEDVVFAIGGDDLPGNGEAH